MGQQGYCAYNDDAHKGLNTLKLIFQTERLCSSTGKKHAGTGLPAVQGSIGDFVATDFHIKFSRLKLDDFY